MMRSKSLAPFTAIIVAAGQGQRAGGAVPKQFALYRGKPLIRHSVEAMLDAEPTRVLVAHSRWLARPSCRRPLLALVPWI